jgi:hypothetical protein
LKFASTKKIKTMQTIVLEKVRNERTGRSTGFSFANWYKKIEPSVEFNRFGITAALILIQVSVAGFNVVIPALAGASVWLMAPGILMAFLANSIAFAQLNMRVVLATFALSILINAIISLYCLVQLM